MIVGASIAGCAAAIMYAQQGLRIALLDARSDIRAHKVLCTHHLQPCGAPILQRLGATEKLLALGMVETVPTFWTPWGMITPDAAENSPPPGFNVRRETLDPLLRQLANDYPNVDLLLGHRVSGLLTENGTTAGVYGTEQGSAFTVGARLTVGADGKDSTVARSARCDSVTASNGRFSYFAQLSGLERPGGETSLSWFMDPDVAICSPTTAESACWSSSLPSTSSARSLTTCLLLSSSTPTHYPALRLFGESTSSGRSLVPNTSPQPSPNP